MLAPIPPGRTIRSSTRNERDTLCSWSGSSCSANRPGKCMRWSVAIEPVTAIFIVASGGRGLQVGRLVSRHLGRISQAALVSLPAGPHDPAGTHDDAHPALRPGGHLD